MQFNEFPRAPAQAGADAQRYLGNRQELSSPVPGLQRFHGSAEAGPGWYDSTRELLAGLDVVEGAVWPGD